mmetsp:Transcript_17124/g.38918  ORF Transcript_17124/g.38918 Transcript_17124/m.38918 type:complete len:122 (+) Transcript_17124:149-514(+)
MEGSSQEVTTATALPESDMALERVLVEGTEEEVRVHSRLGPVVLQADGSEGFMRWQDRQRQSINWFETMTPTWKTKEWYERSPTERKVIVHMAAKKHKRARERWGLPMPSPSEPVACLASS